MSTQLYRIVNADSGPAVIYLYGTIGDEWWDEDSTSAATFARELEALGNRDVELRVNSEGGYVFEGYAMYSALKRYPGRVTAIVDGLAASAASFLIMAADEIVMGQPAMLMIHRSWGLCIGDVADMTDTAQRLAQLDTQIAEIYASRGNEDAEYFAAAMEATKWLTASEAVELGLADRVDEGLKAAASISSSAVRAMRLGSVPVPVSDTAENITTETDELGEGQEPVAEDSGQEPGEEAQAPAARVVPLYSGTTTLTERR